MTHWCTKEEWCRARKIRSRRRSLAYRQRPDIREYLLKKRKENKERQAELAWKWQKENVDKHRSSVKAWLTRNPEKKKVLYDRWYSNHRVDYNTLRREKYAVLREMQNVVADITKSVISDVVFRFGVDSDSFLRIQDVSDF